MHDHLLALVVLDSHLIHLDVRVVHRGERLCGATWATAVSGPATSIRNEVVCNLLLLLALGLTLNFGELVTSSSLDLLYHDSASMHQWLHLAVLHGPSIQLLLLLRRYRVMDPLL